MSEEMTMEKPKISKKELKAIRKRIKPGRLAKREALAGILFVTPWIFGMLLFMLYPLCMSFWYSLHKINFFKQQFLFRGYENYTQVLFSDVDFIPQMISYITSTVISVPIIVVFALIIAMMLNQNIKGKGFFRLIFFLPVIIVSGPILSMLSTQGAGTITAIDMQAITGAIESFLPSSLAEPISEIFSNMITILWYSGVQILIFLSGLQKIDRSVYEAAKIDGGSGWECFWKITLPTIKPLIMLNCIYTVVFISNNDQNAIIGMIKSAMTSGTKEKGYGYAAAMAWMYSIVVLILVALFALLFVAKKDVYAKQVAKAKKAMKKERRLERKIERRSARNAKKIEKARNRRGYKTYDGSGDY